MTHCLLADGAGPSTDAGAGRWYVRMCHSATGNDLFGP